MSTGYHLVKYNKKLQPKSLDFHFTKTLLLKSKTKSAPPVFAVALDETETNVTTLGKALGVKELRFASEETINELFGGADKNTCKYSLDHFVSA